MPFIRLVKSCFIPHHEPHALPNSNQCIVISLQTSIPLSGCGTILCLCRVESVDTALRLGGNLHVGEACLWQSLAQLEALQNPISTSAADLAAMGTNLPFHTDKLNTAPSHLLDLLVQLPSSKPPSRTVPRSSGPAYNDVRDPSATQMKGHLATVLGEELL